MIHIHRTGIHNLIKETREMYDADSKIYDEVTEMFGYLLGFMEPSVPTLDLREVADRTVLGEEEYPPDLSPLKRI